MMYTGCLEGWFQKRRLAQVFLKDENIAERIVDCLDLNKEDKVLEIGPGLGILTHIILKKTSDLFVLEKDKDLGLFLKKKWPKLKVIVGDALDFFWEKLKNFTKIIGNLPYNVASQILWDLVSSNIEVKKMVFTVQKEVALKITAPVGDKNYGLLSVWLKHFADVKYEFTIGSSSFSPRPKVNSAVISIFPKKDKNRFENKEKFCKLIKICFQKRRKQLKNILKRIWSSDIESYLISIGLGGDVRPERLGPEDFYRLSYLVKEI